MNNDKFIPDYNKESKLKEALEMAIYYCKENIPKVDRWSRQDLESKLVEFEDLQQSIGSSFVCGHFE